MNANIFKTALPLLAATALVACSAAPEQEETGSTSDAIAPEITLGDFNADGVTDGKDAVDYLKSFGIQFRTYGLTDDVYNRAETIPRRPYDYQIKAISDRCLAERGIDREAYPPHKIPQLATMARQLLRMPQQYLRELGARGTHFIVTGELGAFAKRWQGTTNGFKSDYIFYRAPSGFAGKVRYWDTAKSDWAPWESLTNVAYDATLRRATFYRPIGQQWYTADVGAAATSFGNGATLSGTFRTAGGTVYPFSLNAYYSAGGTASPNGFGDDSTCAEHDFEIGKTGRAIALGVATLSDGGEIHEIGHMMKWFVEERSLSFQQNDADRLASLFTGRNEGVASGSAPLIGSGFVTRYAASSADEDFADTWQRYVVDRPALDRRIAEDGASRALQNKVNFLTDIMDVPDPAPAAQVHPSRGVTYFFSTREALRWGTMSGNTPSIPLPFPENPQSHTTPAVASNDASKLWLFTNRPDNLLVYRSIDDTGKFSDWSSLGHFTRFPVTATMVKPGVMGAFMVGNDYRLYYRLLDSVTGALQSTGSIGGMTTTQPISVASYNGKIYLFAIDSTSTLQYTTLDSAFQPTAWQSLGRARHVSAARARKPSGATGIYVLAVDESFHLKYATVDAGFSGWTRDASNAVMQSNPSLTSAREVYVKGMNGKMYTKTLETTEPFVLVPGL